MDILHPLVASDRIRRYFKTMIRYGLVIVGLAVALISGSAGAAIYVYTDASGTHYTDTPVHGAKRVDLPKAQSYSPGKIPSPSTFDTDDSDQQKRQAYYHQVNLASPQPKQTFRSAERLVPVTVTVDPVLRPQDRIMIYRNGKQALPSPTRAMSITLKVMGRGAQQVSAAVIGPNGKKLASSAPITFFMKPPTIDRVGTTASH